MSPSDVQMNDFYRNINASTNRDKDASKFSVRLNTFALHQVMYVYLNMLCYLSGLYKGDYPGKHETLVQRWSNVGLLLAHRLRRWPNTNICCL